MDAATVKRLNALTQELYDHLAVEFSQTRSQPWPGQMKIIADIGQALPNQAEVLDIGCGNGRLIQSLSNLTSQVRYWGIDASVKLMGILLEQYPELKSHIALVRLPAETWPADWPAKYDLITCFGLIHHMPGINLRRDLIRQIKQGLKPSGQAVISFWQFAKTKIASKAATEAELTALQINPASLAINDYLLPFGTGRHYWRYCHSFSISEATALLNQAGLEITGVAVGEKPGERGNIYVQTQLPKQ